MNGLRRFGAALSKPASAIAIRVLKEDRPGTGDWLKGVLVGVDRRATEPPKAVRSHDRFAIDLLQAFSEVDSSVDSLQVVAKLARRSPPRSTGVEADEQLRFFVEAYLNEIYILQQRSTALLTFVTRAYRKDPRAQAVSRSIATLRKVFDSALGPIVLTRGVHVHRRRYNDFQVHRLSTLRLLATSDPIFASIHASALRTARKTTVGWMGRNNTEILKLLDYCFDQLHPIVFDDTGVLRYPSVSRAG